MISPTAFNFCPTNRTNDAHNDVNQDEERDLMARLSRDSAILDEILPSAVVFGEGETLACVEFG
jgi:hypothetical protein